jgi:predicted patatin/cPLA2 family phospholipase
MPTMFPPVEVEGHLFVDGGLRDVTPLSAPFLAARQGICKPELILVVNASPRETPPWNGPRPPRIPDIASRGTEIMVNEIIRNDVEVAEVLNELARSGHGTPPLRLPIVVVWLDTTLGLDALDFDRVPVRRQLRDHGRAKGRQFIERFRSFLRRQGLPEEGDIRIWRAWMEASGPRADATLTVHV